MTTKADDPVLAKIGEQWMPLPSRDVTADEFRLAAAEAGWDPKTVEMFLRPPACRKRVQVGKEGLKVRHG